MDDKWKSFCYSQRGISHISDDMAKLYMKSNGSDNERTITVRKKVSTGEWFLYDEMLLADIRAPKSLDPWS